MKRVALLVFAALMAMGLATLASSEVPTDSEFQIPRTFFFEYEGDLLFPGDSGVTEPGATGWFTSKTLSLTIYTNYRIHIGLQQSAFYNTGDNSIILPTRCGGKGAFFAGADPAWLPEWTNIDNTASKYWVGTTHFNPGVYSGTFRLQVQRSGYSDPHGTYVSDCYFMVSDEG